MVSPPYWTGNIHPWQSGQTTGALLKVADEKHLITARCVIYMHIQKTRAPEIKSKHFSCNKLSVTLFLKKTTLFFFVPIYKSTCIQSHNLVFKFLQSQLQWTFNLNVIDSRLHNLHSLPENMCRNAKIWQLSQTHSGIYSQDKLPCPFSSQPVWLWDVVRE